MKFKGQEIEPYECFYCNTNSGEFNRGQLGGHRKDGEM